MPVRSSVLPEPKFTAPEAAIWADDVWLAARLRVLPVVRTRLPMELV